MGNGQHGHCGVSVVSLVVKEQRIVAELVTLLFRVLEAETVRVKENKSCRVPWYCVLYMVNGLNGRNGQNAVKAARLE